MDTFKEPIQVIGQCPSCKANNSGQSSFCTSCKYPFEADAETKEKFMQQRRRLVNEYYSADQKVHRAGNVLYFLAGVTLLQFVFVFWLSGWQIFLPGTILLLSMTIYAVLGILVKHFGLVPLVIGTSLYGLELLGALISLNIFVLIVRALLFTTLLLGTIQASKAIKIKDEIRGKLGDGFLRTLK